MNICTNDSLKSEVEKRKEEVKIGTKLFYNDKDNYGKYEVVAVDEDYFVATDENGEEDYYFFEELQIGWMF